MVAFTRGATCAVALVAGIASLSISTSAARAQLTTAQAIEQLTSSSPTEVRAAIEAIGLSGSASAVGPLSDRIRRGLPPDVLGMAVDTLTVLGHAEAGPVLVELLSHRRADVRTRAVQALAVCNPPGVESALARALDDASPAVRAAAAIALGEHGGAATLDALFRAFDRQIAEAGMAIARIADAAAVQRVLGYLGREPFATLRPMLLVMLERTELPQRARLDIVARVGELATADARGLLEELVSSSGLASTDPVYRAANEAAARIAE